MKLLPDYTDSQKQDGNFFMSVTPALSPSHSQLLMCTFWDVLTTQTWCFRQKEQSRNKQMVTSNLELLPNKYILHPGCKDVDLQIASLPYTILLDPCASLAIYLEVDSSGNFFQFKCSLKKKKKFFFFSVSTWLHFKAGQYKGTSRQYLWHE